MKLFKFEKNDYKKMFACLDMPLLLVLVIFVPISLIVISSALSNTAYGLQNQARNLLIAFSAMLIFSFINIRVLLDFSPIFYFISLILLFGVELFGETSKGATRWLNIGIVRIQPSEIFKIALPMVLAWYFHRRDGKPNILDFSLGIVLLIIPCSLIAFEPDLGTALLVFFAGFFVIYFAGFPLKFFLAMTISIASCIVFLIFNQENLCKPTVDWLILHEYQKNRICSLLNPNLDPLGRSFHSIQSVIAIGSGGIFGKGYMKGTQTHLSFVPERSTDFVLSVYAEEFGFFGVCFLILLYSLLISRGFWIAMKASSKFGRLLSASLTMMIFIYVFVNLGMVTGILPVVGVPLPFMSYGGTALLTMGIACGLLMNISKDRS